MLSLDAIRNSFSDTQKLYKKEPFLRQKQGFLARFFQVALILKTSSAGGSLGPEHYLRIDSLRATNTGSIDVDTI
jgi:hypothetical protein